MCPDIDVDVAIIGYGPVGHVMAALMGQLGWRVAVIERQLALYPLPRIGHLDHEVMRIIQAVGVAEEFARYACVCSSYEWVNADAKTLIHFDWSNAQETGWASHYLFYQPDLDALLARSVERLPNVSVFRGWDCNTINQDEEQVCLVCQDRDGKERRFKSRFLIGADGANSTTRRLCGMGWEDLGFQADWLVVDYRPNDPNATIEMPEAGQICDPSRPTSLFRRIGHYHCRWEFMLLPGETREEMEQPARIWQLLSRWVLPQDGEIVRKSVYTFRSGLARSWRTERTLLIGDAAHLMPPFLGQGMGSGFRDAFNLGWKLDLILRESGSMDLLDTFMEERRPHVSAIIDQAVSLGKVVCESDHEKARVRDKALLDGIVPPLPPFPTLSGRLFSRTDTEFSGVMGPQFRIGRGVTVGLLDDLLGHAWHILVVSDEVADRVSCRLKTGQSNVLKLLNVKDTASNDTDLLDVDGKYREYFERNSIVALVIRPDFYIYGAARTVPDMDSLVGDVSVVLDMCSGH